MAQILLENARIFDGFSAECGEGMSVLIESGAIREVSDRPIKADDAQRIDVRGKTLMPGLIDLHIHAYFSDLNAKVVDGRDAPYRTAHAVKKLGHALDCGFTTVRDIGGGDYPLASAIGDGQIKINPSPPTPKCRSATDRASSAGSLGIWELKQSTYT